MSMFRGLSVAGTALMAIAVLSLGGVSVASAGTYSSAAPAPPRVSVPPPPPQFQQLYQSGSGGVGGLTQVNYTNWSGYADSSAAASEEYTKVSSSFTEPKITCDASMSGQYQIAVFWDGIDGFANQRVEQGGTEAWCYGGQGPFYDTWWEEFPTNAIQDVGTTVQAGDKIAVSVVRSGTKYTVKVTDSTHTANSFTHSFTCASSTCPNSSAEWIAEAPTNLSNNTLYPLAKFSTWTNGNSAVANSGTSGHIKTFPDDEITMVGNNDVKASPGTLNSTGTKFSVTWKNYS
jgi:Peptidase A4 family